MAKRDVELVIKAKNEASRAIEQVSAVLRDLAENQDALASGSDRTQGSLTQLVSAISSVEKAYRQIDNAATQAQASLAAQQATLAASEANYTALRSQIEAAQRAIVSLAIASRNDPTGGFAARLSSAQQALRSLNSELSKAGRESEKQAASLSRAEAAYREVESAASLATFALAEFGDEGQRAAAKAGAAADSQAEKYRQMAAAAREAAAADAAQSRINSLVAPGLDGASKSARDAAAILEVVAAREAEAEAIQKQVSAARAEAQASAEQDAINRRLAPGLVEKAKSARESASAFAEEAAAAEKVAAEQAQLTARAAALKAQIDPLAAVQNRLNAELAEAELLYEKGALSAQELAAAQDLLKRRAAAAADALQASGAAAAGSARGAAQKPALFGLKSYELTNLGYQLNDVFTQLASGTSVAQTFAQQGGQLVQLFPQLAARLLRFTPQAAVVAVTLTALAQALGRVVAFRQQTREFAAILAVSGEGAQAQAEGLAAAARALDRYGASAADAQKAVRVLAGSNINPERFQQFGEAAKNLVTIFGGEVPEATKKLVEAFDGSFKSIDKLNKELPFLTVAQRNNIRELYAQGRGAEAAAKAFGLLSDKLKTGANLAQGPWSKAFRALGGAWSAFIDSLSNLPPFQRAGKALEDLANKATDLFNRLAGKRDAATVSRELIDTQNRINQILAERKTLTETNPRTGTLNAALEGELQSFARLNSELLRIQKKASEERQTNLNQETEARRVATAAYIENVQKEIQAELDRTRADTDAKKAAIAAQEAYNNALDNDVSQADASQIKEMVRASELARLSELRRQEAEKRAADEREREDKRRQKEEQDRIENQAEFNAELDAEIKLRQQNAADSKALLGLRGMELLMEERRQFIADAVAKRRADAIKNETALTEAQIDALKAAAQAEWDAANAGKLAAVDKEAAEQRVNDLLEWRQTLYEAISAAEDTGQTARVEELRTALEGVNGQLATAIQSATNLYLALANNPTALAALGMTATQIQTLIEKMDTLQLTTKKVGNEFLMSGRQINEAFADGATQAFDKLAQSIAEGNNVFKSLRDAFLQFAADFLRQIAQMIIKQAIFNAISGGAQGGAGSGSGGFGGALAGFIGKLFHEGGVVGSGGRSRLVSPALFANAMRYHGGGIAGLKPGEVPAILKRGEEVLTESDPRHLANGGASQPMNVRVINTIDAGDFVSKGLGTPVGEKAILNFMRANAGSIKQALA